MRKILITSLLIALLIVLGSAKDKPYQVHTATGQYITDVQMTGQETKPFIDHFNRKITLPQGTEILPGYVYKEKTVISSKPDKHNDIETVYQRYNTDGSFKDMQTTKDTIKRKVGKDIYRSITLVTSKGYEGSLEEYLKH